MARVRLESLKKHYGSVRAIDGVSINIESGQLVVLLGPSGCGKTTTLRCIAGLEQPTMGKIYFDDREVTHLSPSERNVGMVFQFYALYPHMNVYENITFPLRACRVPRKAIETKVKEVVQIFQLGGLLRYKASILPPGDQQRVALARAVIRDPNVLLLDEPLSALDEKFREEMRSELGKLQKRIGITTIYVTHDQREAMALGDVIVVMKDGVIVQMGSPEELYEHPQSVFVGNFLGTPGMNFVECLYDNGLLFLEGTEHRLSLKRSDLFAKLSSYQGKEVILGIRPEYVSLFEKSFENGLSIAILAIEPAGRYRLVDFLIGERVFRVRTDWSLPLIVGHKVYLYFSEDHICLFDRSSGEAIVT